MKTFIFFFLVALSCSCKKDYTCTCATTKTTANIYYLNKIESAQNSSQLESESEIISGTKKKTAEKCTEKNNSYSEENTELPVGRTGGQLTYETTCEIL